MKAQIQFLLDGANVKRYHTVTALIPETVGHHSHGVALLACMFMEPTVNLLFAALTHDLAEHRTGDIPASTKREFGIGDQFGALEERILEESGWAAEALTEEEARALKLADIAQGALYCVEEINRGNSKMRTVFDRYISYANAMNLKGFEGVIFSQIEEMLVS